MQDNRPVALRLIHGLMSSPQEFGMIAHALRQQGLNYEPVQVEGYTSPETGTVDGWQQWLERAGRSLDDSVSRGSPLILGGLCMGGVLAAGLALQNRRRVDGLVLISPTFVYDGWGLSRLTKLRKIAYALHIDRFIQVAEREPFGVKNERIRSFIRRDMESKRASAAGPSRLSLRAIREGERLMAWTRERMADIRCPILIIHSTQDEITSIESVRAFVKQCKAPNVRLLEVEQSHHMITIDNDRHRVVEAISAFARTDLSLLAPIEERRRPVVHPLAA